MRHLLAFLIMSSMFLGCDTKEKNEPKADSKMVYEMYEPSEMAILMNAMYDHNLKIKQEILNGDIPEEFPLDFLRIHSAELSEFKSRNETFQAFSKLFIEAERDIFDETSEIPIEDRFNRAVGLCISCHETECTGPIPRIKKLLIK